MVALWIIAILAFVQGIFEWLPISSKGQLILVLTWLGESENVLSIVLFMHIGTLIAVTIRLYPDILMLFGIKKKKNSISSQGENNNEITIQENEDIIKNGEFRTKQKFLWKFIILATIATAIVGVPLFFLVDYLLNLGSELIYFAGGKISSGQIITMVIGLFLIITGIFILIARKKKAKKSLYDMKKWEIFILGLVQGLTIIPGISRSGSTVGTMLIEGVDDEDSLHGSFLLSIPAILGANILAIIIDIAQGEALFAGIPWYGAILAIIISGVIGFITIDLLLRLAKKVNFGWFCIIFGSLALVITSIVIVLAMLAI